MKKWQKKENKMITVYASFDCGCCEAEMKFNSLESANEAFIKAGLGNGMSITDDEGVVHKGIDTFYGFCQKEEEVTNRDLKYLAGKSRRGKR
jgi:hypothetical protein